jgi:hypothetical protein
MKLGMGALPDFINARRLAQPLVDDRVGIALRNAAQCLDPCLEQLAATPLLQRTHARELLHQRDPASVIVPPAI